MKTFLDTNVAKSKTFLLYGNLKDIIWCPDLMPRDLEHYLVKLLKSRGYEHVIFYGEAGTKGAYCLDEKSARFFFSANEGIPFPGFPQEWPENLPQSSGPEEQKSGGPATGSQVSDALDGLFESMEDDAYEPGDLTAADTAAAEESRSAAMVSRNTESYSQRIRYAYRGQAMSEFLQKIHPLMLKRESHMAVVFYNILTTDMKNSGLRDDILDIWEKNSKGNICLMMVPETLDNTLSLENVVRQYGLGSKFMHKLPNSDHYIPDDKNCIRICQPGTDEIRNMLRYLSLVGTENGCRITFQYSEFERLAERIAYASGKKAGMSALCAESAGESMREIYSRLAAYIDAGVQKGKIKEITSADVDAAWEIESEEGKALRELNRPGWEPAYKKVTEVLKIAEKEKERIQKASGQTGNSQRKTADWSVQRVETEPDNQDSGRQQIPNFVLLGNPGTGKTTIARLIGRILHETGLLKVGKTVEAKKESLTSSYVAGVPKATMAQVDAAEEGVLFIDEAHLLGKKDGGAGHDGTGVEVVSTLNAAMTSPNHHFSVILAGYEEEMEAVFELDPGFKSRFGSHFIYLEDYPPKLLASILLREMEAKGYQIDDGLISEKTTADMPYVPLQCMVERLYSERDRKRFGNARDIIALAEAAEGNSTGGLITQACFYGGLNGKINSEWFSPMDVGASADFILEEMNRNFVGMHEAKEALRNIGLELEDYKARGIPLEEIKLQPLILVGNPGTGKTSFANLLPKLYFHYHLLGTARPVIVHASSLADKYSGGSQEKVLAYIKKAQEVKGFLFVDEAHELLNEHFDGHGAFKAFMAPTTDREHPFLACFAVYPSRLKEFLAMDPGAERRFRIIHLEDYNGTQLCEIMYRMMGEKGYRTVAGTDRLLQQAFEHIYLTRTESTGNAGKVANILNEMDIRRRQRCKEGQIPFESKESRIFLPQDIPEKYCRHLTALDAASRIEQMQDIKVRIQSERTGADELKKILLGKIDAIIYQKKFPKRAKIIEPGHYFFKGSPGTGKTTGAAFFAKYMYELGLVQDPEPVSISASSLVGQYLGETGVKTREQLVGSVGKVLMIDEAYALADTNDHANSFKRDAVNEIVNFLDHESYRKITCVIFAGYEHDMDQLYQMNSGLKSRVMDVSFEDFTLAQCMAVLKSNLEKEGVSLSQDAQAACEAQVCMMQQSSDFANGRTIRRYGDLLCAMMEKRCIGQDEEYAEDDPHAYEIQFVDVPEDDYVKKKLNV